LDDVWEWTTVESGREILHGLRPELRKDVMMASPTVAEDLMEAAELSEASTRASAQHHRHAQTGTTVAADIARVTQRHDIHGVSDGGAADDHRRRARHAALPGCRTPTGR